MVEKASMLWRQKGARFDPPQASDRLGGRDRLPGKHVSYPSIKSSSHPRVRRAYLSPRAWKPNLNPLLSNRLIARFACIGPDQPIERRQSSRLCGERRGGEGSSSSSSGERDPCPEYKRIDPRTQLCCNPGAIITIIIRATACW